MLQVGRVPSSDQEASRSRVKRLRFNTRLLLQVEVFERPFLASPVLARVYAFRNCKNQEKCDREADTVNGRVLLRKQVYNRRYHQNQSCETKPDRDLFAGDLN